MKGKAKDGNQGYTMDDGIDDVGTDVASSNTVGSVPEGEMMGQGLGLGLALGLATHRTETGSANNPQTA